MLMNKGMTVINVRSELGAWKYVFKLSNKCLSRSIKVLEKFLFGLAFGRGPGTVWRGTSTETAARNTSTVQNFILSPNSQLPDGSRSSIVLA